MNITFQGNKITLIGKTLNIGDCLEDFKVVDNNLNEVSLKDLPGKKVFLTVPSLDTPVCDLEVRTFNNKVGKLDYNVYAISMDLPFAQSRWCGAKGVNNVSTLSDYKNHSFSKVTGTYIEELSLLTRSVIVVDENNKVTYIEYVEEVTNEPDYEACLNSLK